MKTIEDCLINADPIIKEIRRAKTFLAQRNDFDVMKMIESLKLRQEKERCEPVDRANDCAGFVS